MPETPHLDRALRAAKPLRIGDVVLLPIERVTVRPGRRGPATWVTAALEPCAVIVRDAGGVRVLGVGEAPPPLDRLREGLPEIDALLSAI